MQTQLRAKFINLRGHKDILKNTIFNDRAVKMVAVPHLRAVSNKVTTEGGHMGVTTMHVGKKYVEKELNKHETEEFYGTYTFKRRHTLKID